jgi:maltose-binding protein MalE
MNERIRELANKAAVAGYFAYDTEYSTPIPVLPESEKLAELVVQECISLFNGTRETKTVGMLTHTQVVEQIKKHFGVE